MGLIYIFVIKIIMVPKIQRNKPIFRIFLVDCSAIVNKYFFHLFGNKAGANPSMISTSPKAKITVSIINVLALKSEYNTILNVSLH